jgi:hypothetical protein
MHVTPAQLLWMRRSARLPVIFGNWSFAFRSAEDRLAERWRSDAAQFGRSVRSLGLKADWC